MDSVWTGPGWTDTPVPLANLQQYCSGSWLLATASARGHTADALRWLSKE